MNTAVLLAALLTFGPAHYEHGKSHLPYHADWGPYRIVVETVSPQKTNRLEHVLILDRHHHTLREIRASIILQAENLKLTGRRSADLHIAMWSGGANCCFTDVFFTRNGGLRNILIVDGEDGGIKSIKDLNHDGLPEIIVANPVLGDFSAYHFHRHWPLMTILGWNGRRYIDVTRRYPRRSFQEANARRQSILKALYGPETRQRWEVQDMIIAYYANMLAVGRGSAARRWLKRNVPHNEWKWVQSHDKELRGIVATAAQRRASVRQVKRIEQISRPHETATAALFANLQFPSNYPVSHQ